MTIYRFLGEHKDYSESYDTYDTEFDSCVTVEYIPTSWDEPIYTFARELYKHVKCLSKTPYESIICDWSGFIKKYQKQLTEFMEKHWSRQYKDEDDFIYEWIKEINLYLAGYVGDSCYKNFNKIVFGIE